MKNDPSKVTSSSAKGSVKEALGKVTGDAKLEAEGRADQTEGKAQKKGAAIDAAGHRAPKSKTNS